ncbi:MAG: hypothetical protein KKA62_02605 [Nanoarchaeota archaeon]|nr:hypothetical protein [Nanoarchaeota archaeon]MBU1643618.1 hypothetical protein [Nanoarchaeota archaeon]MBU1976822.1 hypothetical protein [Nanoarchaeota archaeon]
MKKTLAGLGLIVALFTGYDNQSKAENKEIEISGLPLSAKVAVAGTCSGMAGYMSTVLDVNGKAVIARLYKEGDVSYVVDAAALIQSEIDDKDNEKVKLKGRYNDDQLFIIKSIEANNVKMYF